MLSSNTVQFIPILDRSNYELGSTVMKAFLMFLNLWAHIMGVTTAPMEDINAQGVATNQEA